MFCMYLTLSFERELRNCLYNLFLWFIGFNYPLEIWGQLFSFYILKRKTTVKDSLVLSYKWVVNHICIFSLINETPIGSTQDNWIIFFTFYLYLSELSLSLSFLSEAERRKKIGFLSKLCRNRVVLKLQ